MYTVKLEFELSDDEVLELVENVIESGGYGINYWAQSAVIDDEAKTYTVTEQEGAYTDDTPPYTLTHGDLLAALVERAKVDTDAYNAIAERDGGYIDSSVADGVIQMAAFGEVIYG